MNNPYTPEEEKALAALLHDAALAEEKFGLDELEEYANKHRPEEETDGRQQPRP